MFNEDNNNDINDLISRVTVALEQRGLASKTISNYTSIYDKLVNYCNNNNITVFNLEIGFDFLNHERNFDSKVLENTINSDDKFYLRAINLIEEFSSSGLILFRYNYNRPSFIINNDLVKILEDFNEYNKVKELKISIYKAHNRNISRFMSFLDVNKININTIDFKNVSDYIKSISGFSNYFVRNNLYSLNLFIKYLKEKGYIKSETIINIPNVKTVKLARVPSVWNQEDINKLLESIDTSSNLGKRDYAIILISIRLGIRSIDIKHLLFENINWENKYIEFVQSKTNTIIKLPLLKDVGWALIDYIKNGRPKTDYNNIFVSHNPPFNPFTDESSLHNITNRYIKLAKLTIEHQKHGLHSFRHTLATNLFEHNTKIEDIASILGHKSSNSTPAYLKASIKFLAECINKDDFI